MHAGWSSNRDSKFQPLCHSAPRKTQLCMQFAFASVPKAHIEKEGVGLENVSVNLVLKIILLFLLKS